MSSLVESGTYGDINTTDTSTKHRQNGAIDQGKSRKRFMERKWKERKYHVQDNAAKRSQRCKNVL